MILRDDPRWDEARRCWNLAVDQRPDAVVVATCAEDVQAVLRSGARGAPQATGHGSELLPGLDGVVLLKTGQLNGVTVADGFVRAGAGALAGDIAAAAGEHGLAPVLGLAVGVGVTGLALGGGTGWLSRAYGLACNNVRAFEAVLASGDHVRVDADHEPELFWALRGGASVAVVSALELDVHPVAEVSAGMLAWPAGRAAEVLEHFRRWTWDLPETTGAVFRYLASPGGSPIVAVVAAHLGPHADGERLLAPLRNGTVVDTFGPVGPADLVHVAGDPVQPLRTRGDSFLLRELDVESVAGLLDDLDPLGALEVRLLGGALARAPHGHGALAKLDAPFSLFAGGPAPDAAAAARLVEVRERLAPWAAPARAFDAAARERLNAVREAYDPGRRLVSAYA
jgi:hypothetical protein